MARKKTKPEETEGGFSKMLATTVVLGIVFSAGLITGQRLLRAEARAPMVSLSTTRVAAQPGVEEGEPKPSLRTTFSFYEHLTGQAEASPPPVAPPVEEAAPEPAAEEEAAPAEEAPVAEPEVKPEAEAPPAVEAKPAPEPATEPKPDAAPKPEPEADSPVSALLDEVVASIADSPDAAETDAPAPLPARYTLQVSSHPDRTSAEREIGRLAQMGVEPHVVKVNVPGKGELWRVRVGKFHTMDEARDFQGTVKSKRGVAGFVTPL